MKCLLQVLSISLLSIMGIITPFSAFADFTPGQPTDPIPVKIDLVNGIVDFNSIPYDHSFSFTGTYPANIVYLEIHLYDAVGEDFYTANDLFLNEIPPHNPKDRIFNIPVTKADIERKFNSDFLLPNHPYAIRIIVTDTLFKTTEYIRQFYAKSKNGDFVQLDFGLAYAPLPKALFPFSSVHFYSTAVNAQTDLWDITDFKRNICLRTSIFLGIAPSILSSDTRQPMKNEFGIGNLILGIGFRSPFYWHYPNLKNGLHRKFYALLQPIRLVFGEVVFKQANENILIPKDKTKLAPYFGMSLDLNIASILGPIGKLLTQ